MRKIAQKTASWMAAVLTVGASHAAWADVAGRYPPQTPAGQWPEAPAALSADARSYDSPSTSTPPAAPRLLPAGYQAAGPETPERTAPGTPRPLPLSPEPSGATSPLAGFTGGEMTPLTNAATSLGIVLGSFLLVVWAVRRGMPRGSTQLPREAVEVLGRATLAGRQQVHLVRCGNKIVLLSVTAAGVEALAEIADPAEVDRLHSICQPVEGRSGLRGWLGKIGPARSTEFYMHDNNESIDFGHLEAGGHRT